MEKVKVFLKFTLKVWLAIVVFNIIKSYLPGSVQDFLKDPVNALQGNPPAAGT
jgi:hypothetical protein